MPAFSRFGLPLSAQLRPAEARALAAGLCALMAMFAFAVLHTVAGVGGRALDHPIRDWLSSGVYVLVAMIVAARALRGSSYRSSWLLFAIGISLYGLGNVVWALWLEHVQSPIPSICDGLWLALYPLSWRSKGRVGSPGRRQAWHGARPRRAPSPCRQLAAADRKWRGPERLPGCHVVQERGQVEAAGARGSAAAGR